MDGLFSELDKEPRFCGLVKAQFEATPPDLAGTVRCSNTLDIKRINYAYVEYQQNLNKFAVLLHSKNPDHYKRAGALLHKRHDASSYEEAPS